MRLCVWWRKTLSKTAATASVTIPFHECEAPLVRAIELLSIRAPAQVSSDLVVSVEGRPIPTPRGWGAIVDEAVW
jgi:hypothetical protein